MVSQCNGYELKARQSSLGGGSLLENPCKVYIGQVSGWLLRDGEGRYHKEGSDDLGKMFEESLCVSSLYGEAALMVRSHLK